MKLSHLSLQAFKQSATTLNVTLAAKQMGLTQSALSQRISALEDELSVTLFIRESRGLKLTEAGERLFRFTLLNQKFEDELLFELTGDAHALAGTVRIGAYSSILRSVIIPTLAPFLLKNPKVQIYFQSYEMNELENVLKTASADIVITDYVWEKKGILKKVIGEEEFVVIESKTHQTFKDVFLDHGPRDNATEDFFRAQSHPPKFYRRSFMGDVYGIIDGVQLGLGRALMSKHLISKNSHIKILNKYQKMKRPVTMYYFEQPYYSKLMTKVLKELENHSRNYFSL
ncbi:MAG: LysR family transcriptional regulator [Bacteriovoracaceae bacterium]|nr:LysR family transcriptional regulator [Bacteriovoracaceae bacterium]